MYVHHHIDIIIIRYTFTRHTHYYIYIWHCKISIELLHRNNCSVLVSQCRLINDVIVCGCLE